MAAFCCAGMALFTSSFDLASPELEWHPVTNRAERTESASTRAIVRAVRFIFLLLNRETSGTDDRRGAESKPPLRSSILREGLRLLCPATRIVVVDGLL